MSMNYAELTEAFLARGDTIERAKALANTWNISTPRIGTHWDGCHRVHTDCLVLAIRAVLETVA